MSAFAKTLEIEWKKAGISICTVRSVIRTELANGGGKLRGHLPKDYLSRSLTAVEILQCLYVDDGAFIFTSRTDLMTGLDLIHKHFARVGLEMHIEREGSPSKTECVFFPSPGFFDSHLPALPHDNDNFRYALDGEHDNIIRHDEQKARARRDREGALYDGLDETQQINVNNGFVTFCLLPSLQVPWILCIIQFM